MPSAAKSGSPASEPSLFPVKPRFTTRLQALHHASTPASRREHEEFVSDAQGLDRRGRRADRERHGHASRGGRIRPVVDGQRRGGARTPAVRAPRRLRPRPDDAAARRLEADRDRAGRGHRHADRRRQRARQRAGPRPRARDRSRRLPRQAVLDVRARGARSGRRPQRRSRPGGAARRDDRDRGARRRPAKLSGLCRRRKRGAHADRVPAPVRPRLRAGPRSDAGRAAAEDLGPPPDEARSHGRRLRPQAAREDRQACAEALVRSHSVRSGLQTRSATEGGGNRSRHGRASADRREGESLRRGAGAVPQPRAVLAGLQRARPRAGRRPESPAPRAPDVLLEVLPAPRRVLRGARQRPHGPGRVGPHGSLSGRTHAAADAGRDPRAGARAVGRAVEPLEAGAAPGAREGRDPHRPDRGLLREGARGARGALRPGDLSRADAARGRARPAVSVHLRSVAVARSVRPGSQDRRGALRASEGSRASAPLHQRREAPPLSAPRARDHVLAHVALPEDGDLRMRAVPRHEGRRLRGLRRSG